MTEKQEQKLTEIIRPMVKKMLKEENQNTLDNRLYLALQGLGRLSNYLSDPKKPIDLDEVVRFRNELRRRYKEVKSMIENSLSKK